MLLGKIFKNLKKEYKNINFENIRFNSKDCKLNDIFFAIDGNFFKGRNYIKDAINNGARIIISNSKFEGFNKKKFCSFIAAIQENYCQKFRVNIIN